MLSWLDERKVFDKMPRREGARWGQVIDLITNSAGVNKATGKCRSIHVSRVY